MKQIAAAISIAVLATVALASPAYADPGADSGRNNRSGTSNGVSQVAQGQGPTVSGVVPATPAKDTGAVASGTAAGHGSAVSQVAQQQGAAGGAGGGSGNSGNNGNAGGNGGGSNSGHNGNDGDHGNGISDVASGLGATISNIAHTLDGDAKVEAIHDAVALHHDAVTEAASHHGNGAADGTGGDATDTAGQEAAGGGNSETARGHGADVSALAHETDGAKGATVSAFASTHGDLVSAAARLLRLTDAGTRAESVEDSDIALESGDVADDDNGNDLSPALDPTDIQLTA